MKERGEMSRQHRRIQLPQIGMILLCLLVGVYLVAWKRFAKADPQGTIIMHPVETHPDAALTYWTEDKKRHAKGAKLPNVNALERGKQDPRRPPRPSRPHQA
jgi:hypothetical protein